jgi:phosphoribosylformylglycinamidine synthase
LARVLERPALLDEYSLMVLPGGFSYGDDVAAGRLFGLELRQGLARELAAFVARGGFVLGVCNGFQVLVEARLLEMGSAAPARSNSEANAGADAGAPASGERSIALANNRSARFECRWITLRAEKSACPWLAPGEVFPAPIAHGEGRFLVRDAATLAHLEAQGQVALRYVHADGSPARGFPDNPNGSVSDIAGLCDPTGRVLGLMPHPERNLTPWNHPHWTRRPRRSEGEGVAFYRRLVEAASLVPV